MKPKKCLGFWEKDGGFSLGIPPFYRMIDVDKVFEALPREAVEREIENTVSVLWEVGKDEKNETLKAFSSRMKQVFGLAEEKK